MSEAGIIILPRPDDLPEGESTEMPDSLEPDGASIKWPSKPGIPRSDLFDPEDSWYDAPPEGFSLTVSLTSTVRQPYCYLSDLKGMIAHDFDVV